MGKEFDLDDDDRRLFMDAVAGAKPLITDKIEPFRPDIPPDPVKTAQDQLDVLREMMSTPFDPLEWENGEEIWHVRHELSREIFRKLRHGQYSVQAELDLHGMTRREARQAVHAFLHEAVTHGKTTVRIIHGKGLGSRHHKPVLKYKLIQWLTQRRDVLAFCSARPVDGGTGAVYVLLSVP